LYFLSSMYSYLNELLSCVRNLDSSYHLCVPCIIILIIMRVQPSLGRDIIWKLFPYWLDLAGARINCSTDFWKSGNRSYKGPSSVVIWKNPQLYVLLFSAHPPSFVIATVFYYHACIHISTLLCIEAIVCYYYCSSEIWELNSLIDFSTQSVTKKKIYIKKILSLLNLEKKNKIYERIKLRHFSENKDICIPSVERVIIRFRLFVYCSDSVHNFPTATPLLHFYSQRCKCYPILLTDIRLMDFIQRNIKIFRCLSSNNCFCIYLFELKYLGI
jgi:hypothetical protein